MLNLKTLYHTRKKLIKLRKEIPESIGVVRSIQVIENMIDYIKLKIKK